MKVSFYDIKAQYREVADELDQVVREVMSSGIYALGPHHNALEREIADRHGMKHGIAVNSGTDALRIMMDATGIGDGDEVITTAFTFVASAETIVQTRARPVFVDIEPGSFMMDAAKIEAAITPKTKAIMPIHLFGQLANVEAIGEIAARHGLIVLEDAAQALDSTFQDKAAGHFGVAAGFSFYVTKNLGAAGDAGMILTNDDAIAETCKSMRIHGMGRERYYYDHLGYTSRMDEVQAAILRVKLRRLTDWNTRRQQIAATYRANFPADLLELPEILPGNNHTWHQFSVRTTHREAFMAHLKAHEVDGMVYYPVPLHFHTPYQGFGSGPGSLPVTEEVAKTVVNLPIHPHMTEDQVGWVVDTVRAFKPA